MDRKNNPGPYFNNVLLYTVRQKGKAIQPNIELRDVQKYNELQVNSAYRIQGFGCQKTDKWQETLDSKYTLLFARFTNLSVIPNDNFPEHYFRFATYNVVTRTLDIKQSLLTGMKHIE